jgi:hypothetical protein
MSKDLNGQPAAKRIVPPYPFEARFKIQIDRADGVLDTVGWARDLSEGGLGAFVATPISLGESVTLRIPLGKNKDAEMVVPAKVTRILGTECGFQFTALSGQQRSQILRAIAGKKAIAVAGSLA